MTLLSSVSVSMLQDGYRIGLDWLGRFVQTIIESVGIIGVGITKGVASVRWATATHIVAAWILTIPATIVMSGFVYWVMGLFLTLPK